MPKRKIKSKKKKQRDIRVKFGAVGALTNVIIPLIIYSYLFAIGVPLYLDPVTPLLSFVTMEIMGIITGFVGGYLIGHALRKSKTVGWIKGGLAGILSAFLMFMAFFIIGPEPIIGIFAAIFMTLIFIVPAFLIGALIGKLRKLK